MTAPSTLAQTAAAPLAYLTAPENTALPDAPSAQTGSSIEYRPPKSRPCPNPAGPITPGEAPPPCAPAQQNWYQRFVRGPQQTPLTPRDKGWLAIRNIADPFNNITILGEAGISVASDSHSPYGPGFPGFGRYVGVSYCQDFIGEFWGTFAIPSLTHQDPHYHRMPEASIPRRIAHAITQVVWTRSDYDKGMLNYANLVGFAIDDQIANLYVPGRETNASATARRYATGLGTAPIGNFITEFVPDVARHIHVQIVIIQRIINQVALKEGGGGATP